VWLLANGPGAANGFLYELDPKTITVRKAIKVGRRPREIVVTANGIWVLHQGSAGLWRIRAQGNVRSEKVLVPGTDHGSIASDGGGLWIQALRRDPLRRDPLNLLIRLDEKTRKVTDQVTGYALAAAGRSSAWITGPGCPNGSVRRYDARFHRLSAGRLCTPIQPVSLEWGDGVLVLGRGIRVGPDPQPQGPPNVRWQVQRFGAATLRPIGRALQPPGRAGSGDMAVGFNSLWAIPDGLLEVYRVPIAQTPT
jgi:hypothetical protein